MFLLTGNIMPGTEKLLRELLFPEEKWLFFSTKRRKNSFSFTYLYFLFSDGGLDSFMKTQSFSSSMSNINGDKHEDSIFRNGGMYYRLG